MEVPLTPIDFGRRARKLYRHEEAVVDGDLRLTYGEFFDRCDRWSAALQAAGVRAGDRVAYITPNSHRQLEAFFGVPLIGAVLVPINYRLTADDFAYIIGHSGSTVVCVHPDLIGAVDGIRGQLEPNLRYVALADEAPAGWESYEGMLAGAPAEFAPHDVAETDLLSLNYTSGTTARPKGVMITHRNAYMNVVGTLIHLQLKPGDGYLWTLPMFHANGWTFPYVVTAVGARHICLPKVDPGEVFRLIREERVGWLCAAPTVVISLANAPAETRGEVPKGVNLITAGAPPAAATIERIEGELGWVITQVYGLTETAPFITICEPRVKHASLSPSERAVIKARQGVELVTSGDLRVVDEHGKDVPQDGQTQGEIVVRGNVVMKGYYNDQAATDQAIVDGWFHSGDAAVVHEDGYAEIRDRIKDVIISGGENISSVEVEGALLRHPAVQEAAVVGLQDERWGESPHAFVVLRPGASADEAELIKFVRDNLAHFKAPKSVNFVDELPKTATGKIQKFVLRRGAAAIATQ